jgi:hypothetical protein
MMAFYHLQIGALEDQELGTSPILYWLFCFLDMIAGRHDGKIQR